MYTGIEGRKLTHNDKLPTSKRASSFVPAMTNLLIGIVCLVCIYVCIYVWIHLYTFNNSIPTHKRILGTSSRL